MNLDYDFFHISKLSEDQRKKVFTKIGRVFFPEFNCCRPTSSDSDADQGQIIGRDADVDHSQIIGGDAGKLLGGIYPPIPPGFRHP